MKRSVPAIILMSAILAGSALAAEWYSPDATRRVTRGTSPGPGWVRNPDDSAVLQRNEKHQITAVLVPPHHCKWRDGGTTHVVGMDVAERAVVDVPRLQRRQHSVIKSSVNARLQIMALTQARVDYVGAGKTAGVIARVDELIAAAEARRDTADALLP